MDLADDIDGSTTSGSTGSSNYSSEEEDLTWVQWYCRQRGNEFLCEVDEAYIQDDFNLTGLSAQVPYYEHALDAVLEIETPNADHFTDDQQDLVDSASELLYGLIHARYILTSRGLHAMKHKFQSVDFGRCPRVKCNGHPVLPVGRSDTACHYSVNVYCPVCGDIYAPKSLRAASLDGAYFGRTFAHLFLMVYPKLVPTAPTDVYIPKIYGFRVAELESSSSRLRTGAGGAGAGAGADTAAGSRRLRVEDGKATGKAKESEDAAAA